MLHAPLRGASAAALVALLLTTALAQESSQSHPTSIASLSISPAVVATFIAHSDRPAIVPGQPVPVPLPEASGPVTLDLLLLWRGSPGWFLKGDEKRESGGGDSKGNVSVHVEQGGVVLDAVLNSANRVVEIAGNQVALGDANVVLVDHVDAPGGPTIAGTRTVDARVQRAPEGVYDVFRGAPDLVPFLRCDARLPVPPRPDGLPAGVPTAAGYLQAVFDANCARIQGK